MKWSILGLILLGGVAALCAGTLVASMQAEKLAPRSPAAELADEAELNVLVAARDLPAMTVIEADGVEVRTVRQSAVPEGSYSDPVQVVGQLLTTPLTAGQAFTVDTLAAPGSGLHLAVALSKGKRAVNVQLDDSMGLEELLYPGSVVDVLASMKVRMDDKVDAQPVSMTILQGVYVLAVGGRTVAGEQLDEERRAVVDRGRRPTVTLLVDPTEAEVLKLAMQEGSVSLALRNPMDDELHDAAGTRTGALAPLLAALEKRAQDKALEKERYELEKARIANERERAQIEIDREKFERQKHEAEKAKEEETTPQWTTVVLKGGAVESRTFDLPQTQRKD